MSGCEQAPPFPLFSFRLDELANDSRALLEKTAVPIAEGVQIVTVNVEFPGDPAVCADRDNDL